MQKSSLGALIALNIALLAALIVVGFAPETAKAQGMVRAQYLMVAGDVAGRQQEQIVYIVELGSARMIAIIFNSGNNTIEVAAPVYNMAGDLTAGVRDR